MGKHPVLASIREAAADIASRAGGVIVVPDPWDPNWFVDLCDGVRARPEDPLYAVAQQMQTAEWQCLFDYCARSRT